MLSQSNMHSEEKKTRFLPHTKLKNQLQITPERLRVNMKSKNLKLLKENTEYLYDLAAEKDFL